MRMLLKCSVLAMSAAGFLAAQHGGGGGHSGGGGGSHGGSSFHSSGSVGSAHYSAPRSSAGYSNYRPSAIPPSSVVQPLGGPYSRSSPVVQSLGFGPSVYNGSIRSGFRPVRGGYPPNRWPLRYGYYGFGLYPGLGFGYYGNDGYDPYYDSGPGVPYAPQQQYDPYAAMPDPNVQMGPGPGAYYPPVPYDVGPQQQPSTPVSDPPAMPIILILKNGQKLEVQSFAIMNGMFWDFTKQNSKRIPIENIDLAASAKATEDAGGSFPEEPFAAGPK